MIVKVDTIAIDELMEMLIDLRKQYDAVDLIVDSDARTVTLDPVIWEKITDERIDKMIT